MQIDELIESAKGRHVRVADLLTSIAGLIRPQPGEHPNTHVLRMCTLADSVDRLAATIKPREERRDAA
jgi:hypothetical protein